MQAIIIVVLALIVGVSNADESGESRAQREAPAPVVVKRQTHPATPDESVPIKGVVDVASVRRSGPKPPTGPRLIGAKSGTHRPLPPRNFRVIQSSVGQRKRR